tara:strand:- start:2305 stop:2469 length:165 start_codon:yes stop_codon:yes gene_type:complete
MTSEDFRKELKILTDKVVNFEPTKKPIGRPFTSQSGKDTMKQSDWRHGLNLRQS